MRHYFKSAEHNTLADVWEAGKKSVLAYQDITRLLAAFWLLFAVKMFANSVSTLSTILSMWGGEGRGGGKFR